MFVPLFCDAKLTDDNFKDFNVFVREAKGNSLDVNNMFISGIPSIFNNPFLLSSSYETDDYLLFIDGFTAYKYDKKEKIIRDVKLFDENEIGKNVASFSIKVDNCFLVISGENFITFDEDLHIIAKKVIKSKDFHGYLLVFHNKYFAILDNEVVYLYDKELNLVKKISYPGSTDSVTAGNDCIYFFNAGATEHVKLNIFDKDYKEKELSLDVPGGYSLRNLAPFKKDSFVILFKGTNDSILRFYDKNGGVLNELKSDNYENIEYFDDKTFLSFNSTEELFSISIIKDDYSFESLDLGIDIEEYEKTEKKIGDVLKKENKELASASFDISSDSISFILFEKGYRGVSNVKKNTFYLRTFDLDGNLILSRDVVPEKIEGENYIRKPLYAIRKIDDYYFSFFRYDENMEFLVYDKDFKVIYKNKVPVKNLDFSESAISKIYPIKGGFFFTFMFVNDLVNNQDDSFFEGFHKDDILNTKDLFDELPYNYIVVNMMLNYKVNSADGIKSNLSKAKYGDKVNFEVEDRNGYVLSSVSIVDGEGNSIKVDGNSFIMPDSNVTIKANYKKMENPNTKSGSILFISFLAITGFVFIYLCRRKNKYI